MLSSPKHVSEVKPHNPSQQAYSGARCLDQLYKTLTSKEHRALPHSLKARRYPGLLHSPGKNPCPRVWSSTTKAKKNP